MSTVVRFYEYGPPNVFKVEDEQVGQPGPGQVRLRHEAIGVNFIDTAFRQGSFPMALPGVTGVEVPASWTPSAPIFETSWWVIDWPIFSRQARMPRCG
jgi:hypothetical protein